jgi:hypothetical protein
MPPSPWGEHVSPFVFATTLKQGRIFWFCHRSNLCLEGHQNNVNSGPRYLDKEKESIKQVKMIICATLLPSDVNRLHVSFATLSMSHCFNKAERQAEEAKETGIGYTENFIFEFFIRVTIE